MEVEGIKKYAENKMKKVYILVFIVSITVSILSFFYREQFIQFKTLGLVGIFLINFFDSATAFLGAIASVVAGGSLYPPLSVAIASALGSALGDMVSFVIGNSGRKIFLPKTERKIYKRLENGFRQWGTVIIFVFALIPNPFFDVVGILAGASFYAPWRFFTILFLGRLVRDFVLAHLGAKLI